MIIISFRLNSSYVLIAAMSLFFHTLGAMEIAYETSNNNSNNYDNNNNILIESPPLIHRTPSPKSEMNSENRMLCDAAHGRVPMDLIEQGANIHATLTDGRTLLMCAAQSCLVTFCAFLTQNGVDITATDNRGYNALMHVDFWRSNPKESIELCELFIHAGIEIDAQTKDGKSALILATEANKPYLVRWLLEHQANLNIADENKNTALLASISKSHVEISEMLILAGANLDTQNDKGDSALSLAVKIQLPSIVKMLLDHGALVDLRDSEAKTAIMKAVQKGDIAMCQLLLQQGAGVNDIDKFGYMPLGFASDSSLYTHTKASQIAQLLFNAGAVIRKNGARNPLCLAAQSGNIEICELILDRGGLFIINCRETKDQGSYTPMHYASLNGHEQVVSFLLSREADSSATSDFGDTALMLAAQGGFDQVVKTLTNLGRKNNVNAQNNDGNTALTLSAAQGSIDVGNILIAAGADIRSRNNDGFSALVIAIGKGYKAFVELLLAAGGQLDEIPQEYAFLTEAARNGLHQVCRFLVIQRKISVNEPDESGCTPIMVARDIQTVETLLDLGADITAQCSSSWGQNSSTYSLLHAAIYRGEEPQVCSLLVEKGLDVNTRDSSDQTPLITAILSGKPSFCEALLAHGADVEAICGIRGTATCVNPLLAAILSEREDLYTMLLQAGASLERTLLLAAECEHLEACKFLLEKGVRVNAKDEKGFTALHYAYQTKNNEIITFLTSRGANCDANEDGYTALHRAVLNRHHDEVTNLLATEIDCNATTSAGDTPLHLAVKKREVAMVKQLLQSKNIRVNAQAGFNETPLHCAVSLTHYFDVIPNIENVIEIVKLLIAHGADFSAENNLHQTPLMCAVGPCACRSVVELLLLQGLDVNAVDNWSGQSALHYATRSLNDDIVALLLVKGANPNARDKEQSTPLHFAAASRASNGKFKEVIELLLSHGADPNARDNCGSSPLHAAVHQGEKPVVVELLLAKGADAKALNSNRETPLHFAKYGGDHIIALLQSSLCCICDASLMGQKENVVAITDACGHRIHRDCREALVDDANFKGECPICKEPIKQDLFDKECFFCLDEFDASVDNGVPVGKNCTHRIHVACRKQLISGALYKGICPTCSASIE